MPAFRLDLTGVDALEQGATWDPRFFFIGLDLSDPAEVRLQFRKDYAVSSPAIITLSSLGGGGSPSGSVTKFQDTTGARGQGVGTWWADIVVTDETMEAIAAAAWTNEGEGAPPEGPFFGVWDLEIELADGVTRRIYEGRAEFKPNVTRAT